MLIVCAGMYRSGSTWQYQVACELVRRAGWSVKPMGFLEGLELAEFLAAPRDQFDCYLYKTHAPDPIHLALEASEVRILYSYRDLRDVTYSMAYKFGVDFWEAVRSNRAVDVCLEIDAFWGSMPDVLVQRYEDWVGDDLSFVHKIAAYIGVDIPDAALIDVAEEFSLDRNRTRTKDLTVQLAAEGIDLSDQANVLRYDPNSLLHWNHIRTGSVGQWHSVATPDERLFLVTACGDWLVKRGYELDQSWAGELRD